MPAGSSATPQSVLGDLSAFMTPQYSVECMAAVCHIRMHPSWLFRAKRRKDIAITKEPTSTIATGIGRTLTSNSPKQGTHRPLPHSYLFRASKQPGYIGSYCMDGIAMALHCVWTTNNFIDAIMKCVNMRGDSDSVGSVCGQIAGKFSSWWLLSSSRCHLRNFYRPEILDQDGLAVGSRCKYSAQSLQTLDPQHVAKRYGKAVKMHRMKIDWGRQNKIVLSSSLLNNSAVNGF